MQSKTLLLNDEFLTRVADYLTDSAEIFLTDAEGDCGAAQDLAELAENTFYRLNCDALLALSHGVEDLALEEGGGTLLASLQNFENFQPHLERFWQLAATLEDVQVVGFGEMPRRHKHIQFCDGGEKAVGKCWSVIYQGPRIQVMLLAEQSNEATLLEEKEFTAFYTFKPVLVERAAADFRDVLGQKCPELVEFKRLQKIDSLAKKIKVEFIREQEAVEVAIRKLMTDEDGASQPGQFAAELGEAIGRLEEWKKRAPDMLARND